MGGSRTASPLVTISIVVLNREWMIGNVIRSIKAQTYPHSLLNIVVVDGGSKDRTPDVAKALLEVSDFYNAEVIIEKSNIPEARNICIEKREGEYLLFWDSDILMGSGAVEALVNNAIEAGRAIISTELLQLDFTGLEESKEKIEEIIGKSPKLSQTLREKKGVPMGSTIIQSEIFDDCRFDNDLTFAEDLDFCLRAREKGAKVFIVEGMVAYDINVGVKDSSDIYLNMPVSCALRGLRKKMRAHAGALDMERSLKNLWGYMSKNKRFFVYLGYLPAVLITLLGFWYRLLFLVLPLYILLVFFLQIRKRGIGRGAVAVYRGIVVGVPMALLLVYYFFNSYD